VSITLYVEGGAKGALATECRRGFAQFLEKAGLKGKMPRVVACGPRNTAYHDFCIAKKLGKNAILLVDSEAPVADQPEPWNHVKNREGDGWEKPIGTNDDELHFMVECMEAWFMADKAVLADYFGSGFNENDLPKQRNIEKISKKDLYSALSKASKKSRKGEYGKGKHSFQILGRICPDKVKGASPYADRFIKKMKEVC